MEPISTFDIFKIGIGPSSSHTLGPWRAAQRFIQHARARGLLQRIRSLRVDLYGSLAKTGKGHGTDTAVLLGLLDADPVTCDVATIHDQVAAIRDSGFLPLSETLRVPFEPAADLWFHMMESLPFHPNGVRFTALLDDGTDWAETYYSIGGGFIVQDGAGGEAEQPPPAPPYAIGTAADLRGLCRETNLSIPEIVWRNELTWRSAEQIREGLDHLWLTMRDCAFRGAHTEGVLPGGLGVVRRAPHLNQTLLGPAAAGRDRDPEAWLALIRGQDRRFPDVLKWITCFALAVNEENASFGRVVTAPTNGAAGVVPAVLLYRLCFHEDVADVVHPFLLTAGVIGSLFKREATLSAAMGGCQAEIGVSSAMAAAGLTQTLGGSPPQVLMAAEIAMEHHLGLTCDPVGGLVQVPCIERNTMGAIKAVTAAHLALESDPARAKVSLDAVIRSMWETALDMNTKYKETSEGGLAVQIPVNVIEC